MTDIPDQSLHFIMFMIQAGVSGVNDFSDVNLVGHFILQSYILYVFTQATPSMGTEFIPNQSKTEIIFYAGKWV